jgi:hypothetical protein
MLMPDFFRKKLNGFLVFLLLLGVTLGKLMAAADSREVGGVDGRTGKET